MDCPICHYHSQDVYIFRSLPTGALRVCNPPPLINVARFNFHPQECVHSESNQIARAIVTDAAKHVITSPNQVSGDQEFPSLTYMAIAYRGPWVEFMASFLTVLVATIFRAESLLCPRTLVDFGNHTRPAMWTLGRIQNHADKNLGPIRSERKFCGLFRRPGCLQEWGLVNWAEKNSA